MIGLTLLADTETVRTPVWLYPEGILNETSIAF
jgi:hypothetical protein